MKLWAMVGLMIVAATPVAHAAEAGEECQIDDGRGAMRERLEGAQTAQPTNAPLALAQREAAEVAARVEQTRRRNGKRIPDAELIGPRGAL